ncbi:hypothetical protein [Loktanella salsilacus]|uniref:hypothetical protein n=1 Tax=Loktanella salsilacus TaxID=195913 RepID=UPI003736481E
MSRFLTATCVAFGALPGFVFANGLGEGRPWDFRTPSEQQILLLGEQTRLNFLAYDRDSVAAGAAASGQTGNSLSIVITGSGNNVIDTGQDNNGDQTIQEANDTGVNAISSDPDAAIADAVARLKDLK